MLSHPHLVILIIHPVTYFSMLSFDHGNYFSEALVQSSKVIHVLTFQSDQMLWICLRFSWFRQLWFSVFIKTKFTKFVYNFLWWCVHANLTLSVLVEWLNKWFSFGSTNGETRLHSEHWTRWTLWVNCWVSIMLVSLSVEHDTLFDFLVDHAESWHIGSVSWMFWGR